MTNLIIIIENEADNSFGHFASSRKILVKEHHHEDITCKLKIKREETHWILNSKGLLKNEVPGSSLDMYICLHVCDTGIYSRDI